MQYLSRELVNLLGSFELDILSFIIDQYHQQKSYDITIRPEQYLLQEDGNLCLDYLDRYVDILSTLECLGFLQFSVEYDKTLKVKLNPEVLQYYLNIPDELVKDLSKREQPERQATADDNTNSKVIPFRRW